jgi:hypothetical protein
VTFPLPVTLTVSVADEAPVKVAETDFDEFIVTVHCVDVPEHAPPQPVKLAPDPGVSVSVVLVPLEYVSEQSVFPFPQLMPLPVTVPFPVTETVRVGDELVVNSAMTAFALSMVNVQVVAVPEHSPPQPTKVAPLLGVAVSVTDVPWL